MRIPFLCLTLFSLAQHLPAAPNILLLCVDDLRPELGCYGSDYIRSPHIDALTKEGTLFRNHYVQAPTCGASRYTLLTGNYGPASNNALFARAKRMAEDPEAVAASLPGWFRSHGYTTVSVGKVSHHPGGWGGKDWDDRGTLEMPESWDRTLMPSGPWQHPRGAMHGLANGEIRTDPKKMDVLQATAGPDEIYPDGLITEQAIREIGNLASADKPFFLAVGIIRPHLPFGAPARYLKPYSQEDLPAVPHPGKPTGKTTWHGSGEFMKYHRWAKDPREDEAFSLELRRHYAACVTYADALIGRILEALDESEAAEETTVVLWGDHGWHLGEHAIWGKHALFEESLRSPLIIRTPGLGARVQSTDAIVETLDLFPTLCELAGIPARDSLDGTSLVPHLRDPDQDGHPAFSYTRNARTVRTATHRLILHQGGHRELYDHRSEEKETRNLASEEKEVADSLAAMIAERFGK